MYETLRKKACDSGHRCQGRCSNKCPPCMFLIDKTLPLCGHNQNVPCSMDPLKWSCTDECQKILKCNHLCGNLCGESHTDRCQVLVTKDWSCGHSATIECYMSNMQCPSVCKSEIGCGHLCKGTCGQCFQGRLHKVCKNRCNRTLLCEHSCKDYCSNCPRVHLSVKIGVFTAIVRKPAANKIKGKYQNEVVKSRTGGIELLNALQQIDELHAFIVKDRSYFTIQETDDILREIERFNLLLKYSLFKDWKLKSDVKMDASFNVNLRRVARYLTDGNPLIDRRKVFVTKFLKVVEDLVPRLGLGLSDEVRTVLVNAKQLYKGYWYKCKNGHVYAIDASAGETEGSICPECKTTIGGRIHRLRERTETML
ncbi:unnamed protein product [Mytilus edulis]|uniref:RZ-type domain-containing protein n=1 Tax=Mytilus edulis TaxID=6550 RepID=A0A8S3TYX3_MYTED|nr:unnamed protein product [Mytilus edulis]